MPRTSKWASGCSAAPSRGGAVLDHAVLAKAFDHRPGALARKPQAQQVALALRFGPVPERGARVQRGIVRQPLDIARAEIHLDRHALFIGDLVEQAQHFDLVVRQLGHAFVFLRGEDIERAGIHAEHPVLQADDRRGIGIGRGLVILAAPVPVERFEQQRRQVGAAAQDLVVDFRAGNQARQPAFARPAQAHQRDDVGTVGVVDQLVAHLGRERGGIVHGLVRRGIDVIEQVAHLVLADRIAHVQAEDVIDRAGQRVGIELRPQAAHQHKAAAEFHFLAPFLASLRGFHQRIVLRLHGTQVGIFSHEARAQRFQFGDLGRAEFIDPVLALAELVTPPGSAAGDGREHRGGRRDHGQGSIPSLGQGRCTTPAMMQCATS
jgi:hypothetical protein